MYEQKQQSLLHPRFAPIGREDAHPELSEKKAESKDTDKPASVATEANERSQAKETAETSQTAETAEVQDLSGMGLSQEDTLMFANRLVRSLMRPKKTQPPPEKTDTTAMILAPKKPDAAAMILAPKKPDAAAMILASETPDATGTITSYQTPDATGTITSYQTPDATGTITSYQKPDAAGIIAAPEKPDATGVIVSPEKADVTGVAVRSESIHERGGLIGEEPEGATVEMSSFLASIKDGESISSGDLPIMSMYATLPEEQRRKRLSSGELPVVSRYAARSEKQANHAHEKPTNHPTEADDAASSASSSAAFSVSSAAASSVSSYAPVHEAEPTLIAQEKANVGIEVDVLAADTPELAVWDDDAPETVLLKTFPPATATQSEMEVVVVPTSAPASAPVPMSVPTMASAPAPMSAPIAASAPTPMSVPTMASAPTPMSVPTMASAPAPMSAPIAASAAVPAKKKRAIVLAERYALLEKIGEGATGEVFRVHDMEVGDIIALKLLSIAHSRKRDSLERFRREVRLARRITHRHIARIFDMGKLGERYYLTMELIQGRSLDRLIASEALSFGRVCALLRPICEGLQAAHEAGVIHRDLKPENILIEQKGRVVITDFGIARQTAGEEVFKTLDGSVMGTPAYMAPEQIKAGSVVDQRADIFALGAILYEMLTGKPVAKGGNLMEVLMSRIQSPPPDPRDIRPDIPANLADLARDCMALDPNERPQDMSVMLVRLAQIRGALEQEDTPRPTARLKGFAEGMLSLLGSKKGNVTP
ncbi:protein kinase [Myxococcota bacterium]|nr:protein kinase [Myxococcota bacterium]